MTEIYDLKIEHLTNPMGIGELSPRFSWKIKSDRTNVFQRAYQIKVYEDENCIWNSGRVESDCSQNIRYEGQTLHSRQRLRVSVMIDTDTERGLVTEGFFEMGLLEKTDWVCSWIEMEDDITDNKMKPVPYIRKKFTVKPGLKAARAYQTAHGTYRFWINGQEGSRRRFAPGNTSYYDRLQYQVDDITSFLTEGENIWAVKVGDGWWRGAVGAFSERNNYGFKVQFLGQLVLEYADGTIEIIGTDGTEKCNFGGTLAADPKFGTVYDAAREAANWRELNFDDSVWESVHRASDEHAVFDALIAEQGVWVQEKETFSPTIFEDKEGSLILDFGQNLSGYVKMILRDCIPGQKITLEHGEGLKNGVFDRSNVIQPGADERDEMFQKVVYFAKGDRMEEFCPEFSFFGFRYVKLEGYDKAKIQAGDFTAIAVYSDLEDTFAFDCSNHLINKLVKNTRWSQKGNFLDVPTDCPTRERAPWTGDAQVYCKTAAEFMDVYAFFEKWMKDVANEQDEDGRMPSIAPSIAPHRLAVNEMGKALDGSAGWGDAATILPLSLYYAYGDTQILVNQYDSAKAWVDYMIANAGVKNDYYKDESYYRENPDGSCDGAYIWDTKFHWGEWSEPNVIMDSIEGDFVGDRIRTGNPVVATAYLRYSSLLLAKMAEIIGKKEDAGYYSRYSAKVAEIYDRYLIHADGSIKFADEGRQAAYVRAIRFELVSAEKKKAVLNKLISLIEKGNYHLNTGFLSTGFLLNVLSDEGYSEAAYRILEQTTPPSWLFPITADATTILESWDGVQEFFGSYNHYSLGAVCDFLFSYSSGIIIDEKNPGYKHFYVKPVPGGSLTHAEGIFQSPYGIIKSKWQKNGEEIKYEFEVPCNTTATIILPDGRSGTVGSGVYRF